MAVLGLEPLISHVLLFIYHPPTHSSNRYSEFLLCHWLSSLAVCWSHLGSFKSYHCLSSTRRDSDLIDLGGEHKYLLFLKHIVLYIRQYILFICEPIQGTYTLGNAVVISNLITIMFIYRAQWHTKI